MRTPHWLQGDGQCGGQRQPLPWSLHSLFRPVALYGGKHMTWSPDDLDSRSTTQSVFTSQCFLMEMRMGLLL